MKTDKTIFTRMFFISLACGALGALLRLGRHHIFPINDTIFNLIDNDMTVLFEHFLAGVGCPAIIVFVCIGIKIVSRIDFNAKTLKENVYCYMLVMIFPSSIYFCLMVNFEYHQVGTGPVNLYQIIAGSIGIVMFAIIGCKHTRFLIREPAQQSHIL